MVAGGYDITQSPLYQATSASLEHDVNKWAAARGLSLSGAAAMKNVNVKSNLMNQSTTQRWNQLSSLAQFSNVGFAQTPNLTGAAANLANTQGYSPGHMGSTIAGLGSVPMDAVNMYMRYQQMNQNPVGMSGGTGTMGGGTYNMGGFVGAY